MRCIHIHLYADLESGECLRGDLTILPAGQLSRQLFRKFAYLRKHTSDSCCNLGDVGIDIKSPLNSDRNACSCRIERVHLCETGSVRLD